jgi:hypothetical protein
MPSVSFSRFEIIKEYTLTEEEREMKKQAYRDIRKKINKLKKRRRSKVIKKSRFIVEYEN